MVSEDLFWLYRSVPRERERERAWNDSTVSSKSQCFRGQNLSPRHEVLDSPETCSRIWQHGFPCITRITKVIDVSAVVNWQLGFSRCVVKCGAVWWRGDGRLCEVCIAVVFRSVVWCSVFCGVVWCGEVAFLVLCDLCLWCCMFLHLEVSHPLPFCYRPLSPRLVSSPPTLSTPNKFPTHCRHH